MTVKKYLLVYIIGIGAVIFFLWNSPDLSPQINLILVTVLVITTIIYALETKRLTDINVKQQKHLIHKEASEKILIPIRKQLPGIESLLKTFCQITESGKELIENNLYLFYQLEPELRESIEDFYSLLEKYKEQWEVAHGRLNDIIKKKLKIEDLSFISHAEIHVTTSPRSYTSKGIRELIFYKQTLESYLKDYKKFKPKFFLPRYNETNKTFIGTEVSKKEFVGVYKSIIKEIKKDDVVRKTEEMQNRLIKHIEILKNDIEKAISSN